MHPTKVFKKLTLIRILFFKNKNNKWCKWKLSGFEGSVFFITFLTIEKKFSNAGYHNNKIINAEETWGNKPILLLKNSIK